MKSKNGLKKLLYELYQKAIAIIFRSYATATIVQSAVSFASMALLSRSLSTHEFGKWVLIEPIILLAAQIGLLGTNHGIIKQIAQDGIMAIDAIMAVLKYIRVSLVLTFCFCVVTASVLEFGFIGSVIVGLWVFFEGLLLVLLSAARGENSVSKYVKSIVSRAAFIILTLVFLVRSDYKNASSDLISIIFLLASIVGLIPLLKPVFFVSIFRFKISDIDGFKNDLYILKYGFPILVAIVIAVLVGNIDRYILAIYFNNQVVGEYAVMAKLASTMTIAAAPIGIWWPTVRFKRISDPDGGVQYFSLITLKIIAFLMLMAGCAWLISPFLSKILAPSVNYAPSINGALLLATLCTAIAIPINIGTLKDGKTYWVPVILTGSLVVQLVFAYVFIHIWGAPGVAWATAVAGFLSLCAQLYVSQKNHKVPLPYKFIAICVFATGFIIFVVSELTDKYYFRLPVFALISSIVYWVVINKFICKQKSINCGL